MARSRYWRRPLDLDRWPVPRGTVHVLNERCKGCGFCVDLCPLEVLELSCEFNTKGYHYPVVRPGKEEACVCCGYCQSVCPDFAIYIEPEDEQS